MQTGTNDFIFGYAKDNVAFFYAQDVENPSTSVWVANNAAVVGNIVDLTAISDQLILFINSKSDLELESIEGLASNYEVGSVVDQWDSYELITQ